MEQPSAGNSCPVVTVARRFARGQRTDHGLAVHLGIAGGGVGVEEVLALGVGEDAHVQPLQHVWRRAVELCAAPPGTHGGGAGLPLLVLRRHACGNDEPAKMGTNASNQRWEHFSISSVLTEVQFLAWFLVWGFMQIPMIKLLPLKKSPPILAQKLFELF